MNPISLSTAATTNAAAAAPAANTSGTQVTKNMFLQLLVAQIKNQDPMNPADSVQFLTQLAQFQQLEQSMNMGQDMAAARTDLDKIVQSAEAQTTPTN
jgi:flagellar basal-body rod modification protein FlgD